MVRSVDEDLKSWISGQARIDVISEFTMERVAEFTKVRVEQLHKQQYFQRNLN